jgi:SAM-dependent methyltransferase
VGIEAVGVEIVKKKIKFAKKSVPKGSFVLADGCKLPFRKECFSTVITNDVLEHVPYNFANPMLSEVKRTLKEDGMFYISVANRYQIH